MILFKATKYLILTTCIEKILDTIHYNFTVSPKIKYREYLRKQLKEITNYKNEIHSNLGKFRDADMVYMRNKLLADVLELEKLSRYHMDEYMNELEKE
jgi:hypothetical protein